MTHIEAREKSDEIAEDIIDMVNGSEEQLADALLAKLLNSHRTLQQGTVRAINKVLVKYAEWHDKHPDCHDLRNESAVEYARQVRDKVQVYLPLI